MVQSVPLALPPRAHVSEPFRARPNPSLMEMKQINSGKLRAIGYDPRARMLQVQLDNGDTLQYSGVGEDMWRRLSDSGAA